jgi:hypothetical protein
MKGAWNPYLYGFRVCTKNYRYYIRCFPHTGDYNFYIYCYRRENERQHEMESGKASPKKIRQEPER